MLPISVYAPNLNKRKDRKDSITREFSDRKEFKLTIVPAKSHPIGAYGLWNTFCDIVRHESEENSSFFIFCEDDHHFTNNYQTAFLKECIEKADSLEADLLLGGVSWLRHPVQIAKNLYSISAFNGMQFTVIFNRLYQKIIEFSERESVVDVFLSHISKNIFVIHPFISVQKEFGYSDATTVNNKPGRVPSLFRNTEARLNRLTKVRDSYQHTLTNFPNFQQTSITTYIINLPERRDRKSWITSQFQDKPEFDIRFVDACLHEIGAVGLWQSICKIVQRAEKEDDDVILICEDDHTFTPFYLRERFMRQVWQAGIIGAQVLFGGIGGFGDLVPIRDDIYWVDWVWCTQFMVVFKKAYATILSAKFTNSDVADEFLSKILHYKFVISPYISIQKDFGYSDVTIKNNVAGNIGNFFKNSSHSASLLRQAALRYNVMKSKEIWPKKEEGFDNFKNYYGLQIGCGDNLLKGWINTDKHIREGVMFLDAELPFPFPNNSFKYIFSEHVLEHLSYEGGKNMLRECFRTLKKGGILRLTIPTLEFIQCILNNPNKEEYQRYCSWSLMNYAPQMYIDFKKKGEALPVALVVNNFFHFWGHKILYDITTLKRLLKEVGFTQIVEQQIGKSRHPLLCNIEGHGRIIPEWANNIESRTLEAYKAIIT